MKKYRSHKVVEAAVIRSYNASTDPSIVVDDATPGTGFEAVSVPGDFFSRGRPEVGDYLVRYADGYLSWSPKKAFEEGYTLVD